MRILILFMLVCTRATVSAATDILSDTARVEREMHGLIEKYCYDCTCESRRLFFREFVKMLERNPASIHFSFTGIKDTCDFRIFTTDDNNLRCYTWNTYCGGTSTDMGGCVQYRTADGKVHVSKEKMGVSVVGISTLRCNDGRTCYLVNDYERGWSNYGAERVFAITIGKDSIETSPILDKGAGSDRWRLMAAAMTSHATATCSTTKATPIWREAWTHPSNPTRAHFPTTSS